MATTLVCDCCKAAKTKLSVQWSALAEAADGGAP